MNISFIGAGKMATALAAGFIRSGVEPGQVFAYDPVKEASSAFCTATGAVAVDSPEKLPLECVVIAVKPQQLEKALAVFDLSKSLVISIVAGASVARIASLTRSCRIVRVMPNTPALVGAGAGAYTVSEDVSVGEAEFAGRLLSGCGRFFAAPESQMDAVTGLSGSGPAYVFCFIQALADGGVTAGLPRSTALELAAATVEGAAKMVLETGMHPVALSDQVMSPGGTTACGILTLKRNNFEAAAADAVLASAAKSAEFGKGK